MVRCSRRLRLRRCGYRPNRKPRKLGRSHIRNRSKPLEARLLRRFRTALYSLGRMNTGIPQFRTGQHSSFRSFVSGGLDSIVDFGQPRIRLAVLRPIRIVQQLLTGLPRQISSDSCQ